MALLEEVETPLDTVEVVEDMEDTDLQLLILVEAVEVMEMVIMAMAEELVNQEHLDLVAPLVWLSLFGKSESSL